MANPEILNCNYHRLYRVNYIDLVSIVPGHTESGEQVLMGELDEHLIVCFFFSAKGDYLRFAFRPIEKEPSTSSQTPVCFQMSQIIQAAKAEYLRELGATAGDIRIHHFAFVEWGIGIAEWPESYFLEVQAAQAKNGELPNDEFIQDWARERQWVLNWGTEYWMSDDGDITAT
jgi:hypothetical protein